MSDIKKAQAWLKKRDLACDICGASAKLAIGSTHSKSFTPSVRCMGHMHGLRQVYGFAIGVTLAVGDGMDRTPGAAGLDKSPNAYENHGKSEASRDDSAWFKANPRRTHRIRPTKAPGGSNAKGYMAIVCQIEPGRMTYVVLEPCAETIPDDDDVLGVLFDAIKQQSERGVKAEVNLYQVVSRAIQLKMTGGTA